MTVCIRKPLPSESTHRSRSTQGEPASAAGRRPQVGLAAYGRHRLNSHARWRRLWLVTEISGSIRLSVHLKRLPNACDHNKHGLNEDRFWLVWSIEKQLSPDGTRETCSQFRLHLLADDSHALPPYPMLNSLFPGCSHIWHRSFLCKTPRISRPCMRRPG